MRRVLPPKKRFYCPTLSETTKNKRGGGKEVRNIIAQEKMGEGKVGYIKIYFVNFEEMNYLLLIQMHAESGEREDPVGKESGHTVKGAKISSSNALEVVPNFSFVNSWVYKLEFI